MLLCEQNPSGFSISFRQRTVIRHSVSQPCIVLGRNSSRMTCSHGVFKLKQDRTLRSLPCSEFSIEQDNGIITVRFGTALTLQCEEKEGRLHMSLSAESDEWNRCSIRIEAAPDEHVYGCGERFGKLDLRGHDVPVWVTEPGVGRGRDYVGILAELHSGVGGAWHNTYFPMPVFVSSANWYFQTGSTSYSRFDFRKKDHFTLYFWEVPESMVIGVCGTAEETVCGLSGLLGRQPELPEWAYDGMWLAAQGGTDTVAGKVKDARDAGVKLAAVWSQDWQGIRVTPYGTQLMWNWDYDRELYHGLPEFIESLHEQGIRFLGYINCYLAMDGPLYREASSLGYLVKDRDGNDYEMAPSTFPVAMIDLTNPDAWEWYSSIIKNNMLGAGLDGWMADFGEYLPLDSVIHSGDPTLFHNRYPEEWARLNRETIDKNGRSRDVLFFSRSGFTGSPRHTPVLWAGDQLVTFHKNHGMQTVIQAGISAGMSGCGIFTFDIGGFFSFVWIRRSAEIWMRTAEMAAFTQIMRSHEGINPPANRQFNSSPEILSHLARMTAVYTHLRPFHMHLAEEYRRTGLPPMRHPYIHYEDDKILHRLEYQYMYGRDLMVAPVIRKRSRTRRLYLPDDEWIHAWSGREYKGGWHRVKAPLGEPPVFYRKGSEYENLFSKLREIP